MIRRSVATEWATAAEKSPPRRGGYERGSLVTGTTFMFLIFIVTDTVLGTAVAQWLRCCATNRKVAGSIAAGVIGIFH